MYNYFSFLALNRSWRLFSLAILRFLLVSHRFSILYLWWAGLRAMRPIFLCPPPDLLLLRGMFIILSISYIPSMRAPTSRAFYPQWGYRHASRQSPETHLPPAQKARFGSSQPNLHKYPHLVRLAFIQGVQKSLYGCEGRNRTDVMRDMNPHGEPAPPRFIGGDVRNRTVVQTSALRRLVCQTQIIPY